MIVGLDILFLMIEFDIVFVCFGIYKVVWEKVVFGSVYIVVVLCGEGFDLMVEYVCNGGVIDGLWCMVMWLFMFGELMCVL